MCNAAQLSLYTKERQSQGYGYKVKEWQKNPQPPALAQSYMNRGKDTTG